MNNNLYAKRIICSESMLSDEKINSLEHADEVMEKISNTTKLLENAPLYIDDTKNITVDEIYEKCTKLKKDKNIKLIVIDNFELIQEKSENYIERKCLQLDKLSRELKIPIIILTQLKEDVAKDPTLYDLDYNRVLADVPDVVIFLYTKDSNINDKNSKNLIDVKICKNRIGHVGDCKLENLVDKYYKYSDI